MKPILEIQNIGKEFLIGGQREPYLSLRDVLANPFKKLKQPPTESFWALNDISFSVMPGESFGIIGRNGAGKSTLLKILSKITPPTKGKIISRGRIASLLEVGTGFHPELTGRENIYMNGSILGMRKKEINKRFDAIVDFSGVEKFLDTPLKRYSSGMQLRLAFAVAAHLDPEILVIDEVLAVGDAEFQKKCLGKMNDISHEEGKTVLFVSHQMGTIMQLCSQTILLDKGNIEAIGNTNEVIQKYISNKNDAIGNIYQLEEGKIQKNRINFFTKVYTSTVNGEYSADFNFDEKIMLNFECIINEPNDNLVVGIGLLDKYQHRISTFLRPVVSLSKTGNKYSGTLTLPASLIAPNSYSFLFVLWTKSSSTTYDNLDNICPVRIYDNGTELAVFEGVDYGNFILNTEWN